jgi:hypothetical protein
LWQNGTVAAMKKYKAISKNVLDYPSTMSMYEKESLAAEAKLRVKEPTAKNRECSVCRTKPSRENESSDTSFQDDGDGGRSSISKRKA